MNIRFTPFRNAKPVRVEEVTPETVSPIGAELVPKAIRIPKARRSVTVVHPKQSEGFRLKSRLLAEGHTSVHVLTRPDTLISLVEEGHRPHVILLHDFIAADTGLTGVEVARLLRTKHGFTGLIYSVSEDHASLAETTLELHGFSGHARSYWSK